jgi:hypothetical protein
MYFTRPAVTILKARLEARKEIELMIETRGPEAVSSFVQAVGAKGYQVKTFAFD